MIYDKNYTKLSIGDSVLVPEPDRSFDDCWNHEFQGQIVDVDLSSCYVVVEDGDGDCFTVEMERVEKI